MMCLVLLKFLLLHSGVPTLALGAAELPVAMPFWIATPAPDGFGRHGRHWSNGRERVSVNGAEPGEPCAVALEPLQAALHCALARA